MPEKDRRTAAENGARLKTITPRNGRRPGQTSGIRLNGPSTALARKPLATSGNHAYSQATRVGPWTTIRGGDTTSMRDEARAAVPEFLRPTASRYRFCGRSAGIVVASSRTRDAPPPVQPA